MKYIITIGLLISSFFLFLLLDVKSVLELVAVLGFTVVLFTNILLRSLFSLFVLLLMFAFCSSSDDSLKNV